VVELVEVLVLVHLVAQVEVVHEMRILVQLWQVALELQVKEMTVAHQQLLMPTVMVLVLVAVVAQVR
jgi:hypothetical protein